MVRVRCWKILLFFGIVICALEQSEGSLSIQKSSRSSPEDSPFTFNLNEEEGPNDLIFTREKRDVKAPTSNSKIKTDFVS